MVDICIAHGGDISRPNGGTDRITNFARYLSKCGFQVTIVTPRPDGQISSELNNSDVQIHYIPLSQDGVKNQLQRALLIARKAKKIAQKSGAVIQFEHSSLAGIGSYMGCSGYILDMHDLIYNQRIYSELPLGKIITSCMYNIEKRAVKNADLIITVSDSLSNVIVDEWGIQRSKMSVIPNGYATGSVRGLSNIEVVEGRVVFLGSIHDKVDIDALKDVASLKKVSQLIIIGKGDFYDKLKAELSKTNGTEIKYKGWLPPDDAFKITASASVAIAPYKYSKQYLTSSPVKLYTYAALGIPIVASEGPDNAAELKKMDAAILVESNQDFAEAVNTVLINDSLKSKMAKNAKEASKKYTWKKRGNKLCEIYKNRDVA